MKKQLIYVVAACSSLSLSAIVDESLSLENLGKVFEKSQEVLAQAQEHFMFNQFRLTIRHFQDLACSTQMNLEQVKETLNEQIIEPFNKIPNDNSEGAYMMRQTLAILKAALKTVADATRKNVLPAVDAQMFKKGVDAQATRLKVIEYIESSLK